MSPKPATPGGGHGQSGAVHGQSGASHGQGQAVRVLAQQLSEASTLLQDVYDGTLSPTDPLVANFLGMDGATIPVPPVVEPPVTP